MRRWDDLFAMLRAARDHVRTHGYGLKPYDDLTRQKVGFICEMMHEVFQISVVLAGDQTERTPGARRLFLTREGRQVLSRALSGKGAVPEAWADDWKELLRELEL